MKLKKSIALILITIMVISLLVSCRQADRVSYNLSQEADNFNITRKITVINIRTDTMLYQVTGNFSIDKEADGDLAVIGENDDGTFYKHFIRLCDELTYISEDLGKTGVDKHKYEINFNPKMLVPMEPVIID